MKKLIIATSLVFLITCCSYKNNKNFHRASQRYNTFLLCYIASEPKVICIDSLDSLEYKYFKSTFNQNNPKESFELLLLKVRTVDWFYTKYAYNDHIRMCKAIGETPAKLDSYINEYNTIYFLHKKTKNDLKKFRINYSQKKLTIFNLVYFYPKNDSTNIIYSFESFNHNSSLKYNNLFKIE